MTDAEVSRPAPYGETHDAGTPRRPSLERMRDSRTYVHGAAPAPTATSKVADAARCVLAVPRPVAAELDDDVRGEVTQKRRARGIAYEPDLPAQPDTEVRVWVRTWSDIVEEAKRRLAYFRDGLDHDPSLEHALEYLIREQADVSPPTLRREPRFR